MDIVRVKRQVAACQVASDIGDGRRAIVFVLHATRMTKGRMLVKRRKKEHTTDQKEGAYLRPERRSIP